MVNRRTAPPALAAANEEAAGGEGLAVARHLGAALREKRLAHGLTIAEVSTLAGIR